MISAMDEGTARRELGRQCSVALATALLVLAGAASLISCSPTIKIEAPDKPITININIRIQVEKDLDALMNKEKE